ncbi:hypothetical protein L1987_25647 [Smallanthus sonchifolius]|uniref:Uncharacterized protein n=1 Tax=Smallanthus sonchifolius TaxID=185202 RepID=A0ACB9I852_9ASTR|nr:hypothetical protein L1987_25647 [Smallanthus sonchifolius]
MLLGPSHQPHVAEEDHLWDHPVVHRSAPPEGLENLELQNLYLHLHSGEARTISFPVFQRQLPSEKTTWFIITVGAHFTVIPPSKPSPSVLTSR